MMLTWLIIRASFKSLWANKMRSFLAMLGILIGVWAVIAMLAVGRGTQDKILNQIKSMGTNLLIVTPSQLSGQGVRGGQKQTLVVADALAMRRVPGVEFVTPAVGGTAQVKHLNQNEPVTVTGIAITYLSIRDYKIDRGRGFTENEAEGLRRIAIIGPTTATKLFGDDDPLGQTIKVNGINFRVVGVTKSKGNQGFYDPDDQVFVPYTTAMRILYGMRFLREIDIQAQDGVSLDQVQADLTTLLQRRHKIHGDTPNDFEIHNQAQILDQVSQITFYLTVFLGCVAGISLLVGGIGIMNIMLVSVTERTREIGVRKAIGAKRRDILQQFLIEAVIISGLSGGMGILLGMFTSLLVALVSTHLGSPLIPVVTLSSVLLSAIFSMGVGIFFGFYPAYRAAALDPIEALRYE